MNNNDNKDEYTARFAITAYTAYARVEGTEQKGASRFHET